MKHITFLVLVAILLSATVQPTTAIVGGQMDSVHTNVGAYVLDFPGKGIVVGCSGTLIHPRLFLTGAHCIGETNNLGVYEDKVWVNFDQNGLNPATMLEVEQMITQPGYAFGPEANPHYDVGLLVLKQPVTHLPLAILPEPQLLATLEADGKLRQGPHGAMFTVVGYGTTVYGAPFSGDGQRRSARSEFTTLLDKWLRLDQNTARGNGGTCFNDSGAPAFWTAPNGSEILVAITTWGDYMCKATGFYWRTDRQDSLDFINRTIQSLR